MESIGADACRNDIVYQRLQCRGRQCGADDGVAALDVGAHVLQPRIGQCFAQVRHGHPVAARWRDAPQQDHVGCQRRERAAQIDRGGAHAILLLKML